MMCSCSCILRSLFKSTNSLSLQFKAFASTINENALKSPDQLLLQESFAYNTKLLKVAIIGMPNAGKSTFINGLMDRKVCATSQKVHTTRTKAKAILTSEDTQIIFIDTPGLVNDREQKKFNLKSQFMKDSRNVSNEADVIGVLHDVANFWTRDKLDIKIIHILENHKQKPSFLVLNKIDVLKSKRKLLDLVKNLTENSISGKPIGTRKKCKKEELQNKGWPYFSDIFMVSALTGDGLDDIRNYFLTKAKPGKWMFPENVWTDQNAELVILNTVKATLLNHMPQEVPYQLEPIIEYFDMDETGKINTVVLVKCPTARISRLLAGSSDGRLRIITESVQKDLQDCFHNFVKIKIVPTPNGEEIK